MKLAPISEAVTHTIGGGWGDEDPGPDTRQVMVIRGADFPAVSLQTLNGVPIRHEVASKVPTRELQPGDIVLEISGGTKDRPTGRSVYITKALWGRAVAPLIPASFCRLVRIDPQRADSRFVYYSLQQLFNEGGTWEYQNQSTGLSNFQFELFRAKYRYPAFSVTEQRAIGEVLGALDDKIAANARVAGVAQELGAHLLVASLDARATTPCLKDLARHQAGKYLPKEAYSGGGAFQVFGSNSVMGRHNDFNCDGRFTVLARIGSSCGALRWSQRPAWVNNNASAIVPRDGINPWVLRHAIKQVDMASFQAGSGQPFIQIEPLMDAEVRWPSRDREAQIGPVLQDLAERECLALEESATLAEMRDALLPQLMSGKIRVRDAERVVEGVV